jgi:broad specificity phosphatase PhoE
MPTRLTLISHASTAALRRASFPLDEPLDDGGIAQAAARAARPLRAHRFVCGPERRTTQTAQALTIEALAVDARPSVAVDLRDIDLGRWAGRTVADVSVQEPSAVQAWLSDPTAAPHGGESVIGLLTRVDSWLNGLPGPGDDPERVQRLGWIERVVAVSHPAVLRAAIVVAIQATPDSFWRVDVPPLTAVTLQHNGSGWTLRSLHDEWPAAPPTADGPIADREADRR